MSLKVLLHIVGPSKFLMATWECALNSLLSCMNLGVTRRMSRRREGLLAAMAFTIPTGVALARLFLGGI